MPQTYPKYNWDIRRTYDENGFAACLAMHCRFLSVQPPEGYSADAIREIARALPPASQPAGDLRPNVIVILSESFWDATRFPGVEFGTDPVPTFHQLQREFGALDMVSPTFGGLTCNAEFEVLTGFNMAFFPESMEAYVDYVRRPVPSLAWMLRGRGYQTVTLHALGGVHNDAQVQPLLGFERCVPGAEWAHRDTVGPWITDDAATSEIIDRTGQLRQPYFVCVNTIEGHTPYDNEKYGPSGGDIRFTKPLSDEARDIVRNYSRGLHNADLALKRLIDHFRDARDPVLIVFYGDHLPILGDDLKVYRETGMCFEGQDSRSLPMRRMQAVIWNNYGRRLSPPSGLIGMNQMLPLLLDLTDTPQPAHVRMLAQIARRWPVVGTAACVDDSGKTVPLDTLDSDPLLQNWRLMQYDLLFGDQQFLNPERQ
jgi:phosphoglycerol transferase MdoB-like AlkP superfamily enzyme